MQASKRGESGPNGKVGPGKGKTPIEPEVLSPRPSGFGSNRASSTYAETRPTQDSMDTIDLDSVSFDRGDTEKAWEAAARAAAAAAAEAGEQNPFERPELEEEDQVAAPPPSVSFSSIEDTIDLQGEDLMDQETKAKEAAEDSKGSIGRTLPKVPMTPPSATPLLCASPVSIGSAPLRTPLEMVTSSFPSLTCRPLNSCPVCAADPHHRRSPSRLCDAREHPLDAHRGPPRHDRQLGENAARSSKLPETMNSALP